MRSSLIAACLAAACLSVTATSAMSAQDEPAVAPELTAAAGALGMVRGVERSTDMINTVQYRARGTETVVGPNGRSVVRKVTKAVVGYSYAIPAGRVDFQGPAAKGAAADRTIRVAAGARAWNESTPGIGLAASPEIALRLADIWITPHGAIRAAITADPSKVSITKEGGKTIVVAPVGALMLRIVLDAKSFPEQVSTEVQDPALGLLKIEAVYSGYKDWDGYDVPFPTRVMHRVNGRPKLDLTVTEFRSNPYVVFPAPSNIAAN